MITEAITNKSKAGGIKASVVFYVQTNLFFAAFCVLPISLISIFFPGAYLGLILLLFSPLAQWFVIKFSAQQLKRVYEYDAEKVLRNSVILYLVINTGIVLFSKQISDQWYISVGDLVYIALVLVFFFASRKYLK